MVQTEEVNAAILAALLLVADGRRVTGVAPDGFVLGGPGRLDYSEWALARFEAAELRFSGSPQSRREIRGAFRKLLVDGAELRSFGTHWRLVEVSMAYFSVLMAREMARSPLKWDAA